jgi:hypothetical protein
MCLIVVPTWYLGSTTSGFLSGKPELRDLKHISMVRCVLASGESLTPFLVSSEVHEMVIESLKAERFGMGVELILEHARKPYMNARLFQHYIAMC